MRSDRLPCNTRHDAHQRSPIHPAKATPDIPALILTFFAAYYRYCSMVKEEGDIATIDAYSTVAE